MGPLETLQNAKILPTDWPSYAFAPPTPLPPFTPGTNTKVTEVLRESFASWEMEVAKHHFPKDPQKWNESAVIHWLHWAIKEFSLYSVNERPFHNLNGLAMIAMGKDRFLDIAPPFTGEILWEHLQMLQSDCCDEMPDSPTSPTDILIRGLLADYSQPHAPPKSDHYNPTATAQFFTFPPTPAVSPEPPMNAEYYHQFRTFDEPLTSNLQMNNNNNDKMPYLLAPACKPCRAAPRHADHSGIAPLSHQPENVPEPESAKTKKENVVIPQESSKRSELWFFLLQLLSDPSYSDFICWTGHEREFIMREPEKVAILWGRKKNNKKMNYATLSRSLRYYYDKKIIQKISYRRYAYKFLIPTEDYVF